MRILEEEEKFIQKKRDDEKTSRKNLFPPFTGRKQVDMKTILWNMRLKRYFLKAQFQKR